MKLIETYADLVVAIQVMGMPKCIEVDTETSGLHFIEHELKLLQIGYGRGKNIIVIDVRKVGLKNVSRCTRKIFESKDVVKIFQHALFDLCFIYQHLGIKVTNIYDTKLAEQVLLGDQTISSSLKEILDRYELAKLDKSLQISFVTYDTPTYTKEQIKYAADDVRYLEKLMIKQLAKATKDDQVIIALENQVVEIVASMRYTGIHFDKARWIEIAEENEKKYNKLLTSMPKEVANWGSTQQVKKYFKECGIVIPSYSDLPELSITIKDKTFKKFVTLRAAYQDVKLYGKKWLEVTLIKKVPVQKANTVHDGKVHCDFRQILETGRLATTHPNLQNLKSDGIHRSCFHAGPGKTFVIADYKGQEIAAAAVASGETRWINAIEKGENIHDNTASSIYGNNYTKEQREMAKRINFAVLYGAGSGTISKNLLISRAAAMDLISKWRKALPTLSAHLKEQAKVAEWDKESCSLYGRRRSLKNTKRIYTVSQNNPIQSTGADMIKVAMVYLDEHFKAKKIGGRVALCIHDEIIVEVDKKYAESFKLVMKKLMENAAEEVLGRKLVTTTPYVTDTWKKY